MSQEELAYGIMDSRNLSKIECGHALPSKKHLELLFEKLGVNPYNLVGVFLDGEMARVQRTTDRLDECLETDNAEDALPIIKQLENNVKFMADKLNRQYVEAAKAAHAGILQEAPEKIMSMLDAAILATRATFDEAQIASEFLTRMEFRIMNMKAIQYTRLERYNEAIQIWAGLAKNMEEHCIDKIERGMRYPHIIFQLTKYMRRLARCDDDYIKIIELCDKGLKACMETGFYRFLPAISTNKAYCLFACGDRETCEVLLRDVCHTARLFGRHKEKEAVKKYAQEELGISLEV